MPTETVRRHAVRIAVCVAVALAVGPARAQQAPSQLPLTARDAERCDQKVHGILRYAEDRSAGRPTERQRTTTLTEAELNSYLRLTIPGEFPAGVVEPYIAALGSGRIAARAVVDLDAVSKSQSGGGLGRLLGGRLPVTLTGTLRGRDGNATFEFESASISGIPVPKMLLQQVVAYYSRSSERPNGVNLDVPFPLPNGIRQLDIQLHQALIVQ